MSVGTDDRHPLSLHAPAGSIVAQHMIITDLQPG